MRLTRREPIAKRLLLAWVVAALCGSSWAANTPCSGKKGGINHCENGRFICNDNSVSQSKKVCMSSEWPGGKGAKSR